MEVMIGPKDFAEQSEEVLSNRGICLKWVEEGCDILRQEKNKRKAKERKENLREKPLQPLRDLPAHTRTAAYKPMNS